MATTVSAERAGATSWLEANQRHLTAAVAGVRAALERYAARNAGVGAEVIDSPPLPTPSPLLPPSALDQLCTAFGLSRFERDILLFCAAMELDGTIARTCAAAAGDPARAYPTFALALAALNEPHWSALSPDAPLRRWRLIDVGPGPALTLSPLRIDEAIVHYLAGVPHLDARLVGLLTPLPVGVPMAPSHRVIATRLMETWTTGGASVLVQLVGAEAGAIRAVVAEASARIGVPAHLLPAELLPTAQGDLHALTELSAREARLRGGILLLDCTEVDLGEAARRGAIARFIGNRGGPVVVAGRDRLPLPQERLLTLEVGRPARGEQRDLWTAALGAAAEPAIIEPLVAQFSLGATAIVNASLDARGRGETAEPLGARLWAACRLQARPRLDDLAQRIETTAGWDELILPPLQRRTLREIVAHLRQRATVYEEWGFAGRGGRGLGISALFAGASGTGKTMAAEVLARELRLDLYRVDLSSVVSKYIGETEKNLRRVFDAAEEGGAILLFDEADALFGKRSEVKDSHDRYANIEVSYLLQRMEAYRGLAILTTNLKSAIDTAFLRRLRFVITFPFPDPVQRAEIWRRVFPAATPTRDLDPVRLAQLNVAGGNIRNIALNAAFLAADAGEPVTMRHLLEAARSEYHKLEKALTGVELAAFGAA